MQSCTATQWRFSHLADDSAVGIFESPKALMNWRVARREVASMISDFEAILVTKDELKDDGSIL